MTSRLANYALYQAGWLSCVLGAAHQRPWLGAGGGAVLIAVHLALVDRPASELKSLLVAGLLGGAVDSLQSCAGFLVFRSGYVVDCLAPPWIVVMWMQFATLFRFALSFLLGRYGLAAALAAIGGPLAFWVGARLGAVQFGAPTARSLIVLGLVWAIALPALLLLTARWTARRPRGRYRGLDHEGAA